MHFAVAYPRDSHTETSREENRPKPHALPSARQSTCGDRRIPEETLAGYGSSSWTPRCCCPAWPRHWSQAHPPTAALCAHLRNSSAGLLLYFRFSVAEGVTCWTCSEHYRRSLLFSRVLHESFPWFLSRVRSRVQFDNWAGSGVVLHERR